MPRTKRDGKMAQNEADAKELRTLIYGSGRGRRREGVWDAQADAFMADHSEYLEGFVEAKDVSKHFQINAMWKRAITHVHVREVWLPN